MNQATLYSVQIARAALLTLMVLQVVMLLAMFSGSPPHPPLVITPFALGPFLGASVALALAAYSLASTQSKFGTWLAMAAGLLAMVSFGPQKWIDPAFTQIWPAVILGQLAFVALIKAVFFTRATSESADQQDHNEMPVTYPK